MEPTHVVTATAPTDGERDRLRRRTPDQVEEIRVRGARAVEILSDHSSVDPAVGLDIGGGKLLLLAGQWLCDEETYGARKSASELDESSLDAWLNRLPPPYAFPSRDFTLRRSATTGEVLSIRVEGEPLSLGPALPGIELTKRRPRDFESWTVEGRLEDLPRLLGGAPAPTIECRTSGREPGHRDEAGLAPRSDHGTTERTACLGAFTAQHFKLLSIDPNTIFQFFVFPDRIFTVKVGTALNQLAQVLSHGAVKGPVGLQDHAGQRMPTAAEARRLVVETSRARAMSLDSPVKSRELPYSLLERVELSTKGMFSKGLTIELRGGGELFFRFLDTRQQELATQLLAQALGPRFTAR